MAKHQQVREALVDSIQRGEYRPKNRLPSERDIAERFGVSYMTARRAVSDLVEANLLERRARSGTFVRIPEKETPVAGIVHLICLAENRALNRAFLQIGARLAAERGERCNVLLLSSPESRDILPLMQRGRGAIVLLEGVERLEHEAPALAEALVKAEGHAVLLANRMDHLRVPSVVADDTVALRMAVAHLREQGHRHIALLSDRPDHPVARIQIATWRSACGEEAAPETWRQRLIIARNSSYDHLPGATYQAVRRFLQTESAAEVTALISLVDEMAIPALAACRDASRPVPEKFAMVSLGDSALLAYAYPPVTCVDVNMEQHLHLAFGLLDAARSGVIDPDHCLWLVEPQLVLRQSVSAVNEIANA